MPEQSKGENLGPLEEFEKPKTDTEYFSSVQRYFNKRVNENKRLSESNETSDEDAIYESFLQNSRDDLAKMAFPERLKKVKPKDVAPALSEILNAMAVHNPNVQKSLPEETIEQDKKEYLEAKAVFIESCKKIFPEIGIGDDLKSELESELNILEELKIKLKGAKVKEKPEDMAHLVDKILVSMGEQVRTSAYGEFKKFHEGQDIDDKKEERLASIEKSLYKL